MYRAVVRGGAAIDRDNKGRTTVESVPERSVKKHPSHGTSPKFYSSENVGQPRPSLPPRFQRLRIVYIRMFVSPEQIFYMSGIQDVYRHADRIT